HPPALFPRLMVLCTSPCLDAPAACTRGPALLEYHGAGPETFPRVPMAANDLVLAFTGASGAPYGVRLLEVLLRAGRTVHLTLSPAAAEVLEHELDRTVTLQRFALADLLGAAADGLDPGRVQYHHYQDFRAGIASGSFLTAGMAVCPCSMGTVA